MMKSNGWRASFGILVIDKDLVAEEELWAMAPPGVTFHAARFASPRKRGSDDYGNDMARTVADSPEIARGLDQLGQMGLGAISVCFSTLSFFGGAGFDEQFAAEATRKAHGTPVTTAGLATLNAIRELGIKRPFVLTAPWFKDEIVRAGESYLTRSTGVTIARTQRFDLGVGWRDMEPWQAWDDNAQFILRPDDVYRQARKGCPSDADGVVLLGNGFRGSEAIDALEADLGVPVVTSNQATMRECLRLARVSPRIDGWGRLLSRRE
jgi:maleate cis-trans isomerase